MTTRLEIEERALVQDEEELLLIEQFYVVPDGDEAARIRSAGYPVTKQGVIEEKRGQIARRRAEIATLKHSQNVRVDRG